MPLSSEDELAIHKLHARYSQAVSRHDVEDWTDLYTQDAVWERKLPGKGTKYDQPLMVEGREALRQMLAGHPLSVGTQYITTNVVVDGDRDSAKGIATILVVEMGTSGASITVVGNCDDEFRKTADGWKFSYRGVNLMSTVESAKSD